MSILNTRMIQLKKKFNNKEEAIRSVGQLLVDGGYVTSDYIASMIERDALVSTYMGNNVAIPHGTEEGKAYVKRTGITVIQVPEGVDFGKGEAKILIGISGKNDDHLALLSQIAIICSEQANVDRLVAASSKEDIIELLGEVDV